MLTEEQKLGLLSQGSKLVFELLSYKDRFEYGELCDMFTPEGAHALVTQLNRFGLAKKCSDTVVLTEFGRRFVIYLQSLHDKSLAA